MPLDSVEEAHSQEDEELLEQVRKHLHLVAGFALQGGLLSARIALPSHRSCALLPPCHYVGAVKEAHSQEDEELLEQCESAETWA